MGKILTIGAAGICIALAWVSWRGTSPAVVSHPALAAATPAEARQQQILKASMGQPGDPLLLAQYAAINARYFDGALPQLAVRWEPALAEVGPLTGDGFTLQGMFGHSGSQSVILLNPIVQGDGRVLDRALCHEIVHAYLWATGDDVTGHGPAFQAVLERLSKAGAFEGIVADATEKARLRAWLDAESAAIDAERQTVAAMDAQIRDVGAELDRAIAAFNARSERPAAEAEQLEGRRQDYNQRALEANARLERDRARFDQFNREVARYNLMMAYPDGLDEVSRVKPKSAR